MWAPSRGRAAVVAGVEASSGGGNGNGNGAGGTVPAATAAATAGPTVPARSPASPAGLGSTGFDSQTELLGLLGLGLVGAGAITLVARRRSHG